MVWCRRVTVFFLLFFLSNTQAEELPLWELGLGAGGLHQSYYTGTKETRGALFPVVMPVYRGDFFKSDDKGVRAELFKDERYKLDVSFDFNFSVDSDEVDLREGMDDIGSLIEVGPSLEVNLFENESEKFYLRFPIRSVTEIGSGEFGSGGYNFSPTLALEKKFLTTSWKLGASVAVKFGDQKYNSIYYGVAPEFSTIERPAYKADGGYAGSRLQLALTSKSSKRLWVLFVRYDDIGSAVFNDSPLVEVNNNVTLGFIYSRYFFKSKQQVKRDN